MRFEYLKNGCIWIGSTHLKIDIKIGSRFFYEAYIWIGSSYFKIIY